MSTLTTEKGKVRLYACGGAGTNVGTRLEKFRGHADAGFAELETVYVDTSKSNLKQGVPQDSVYLIDGLDGSGGIRATNVGPIQERIRDILQQFKPADLNIVLHSLSGGSGSVIGPLLVEEIAKRDVPVVVVVIGDTSTAKFTENSLNTLRSYEAKAKSINAPVVIAYHENSGLTPRSAVDDRIEEIVISLCTLFSRENSEIDSKDLHHWLRFDKPTSFKQPVLAALSLVDKDQSLDNLGNVISVVSLVKDPHQNALTIRPEYQATGVLPANIVNGVLERAPVHYLISDGILPQAASNFSAILKEIEEQRNARLNNKSILGNAQVDDSSGLVL